MYNDTIKRILKKIKGDYFDYEEGLITEGYITSFNLIEIIKEIESTFNIEIQIQNIHPDNFDSISNIDEVVRYHMCRGGKGK